MKIKLPINTLVFLWIVNYIFLLFYFCIFLAFFFFFFKEVTSLIISKREMSL